MSVAILAACSDGGDPKIGGYGGNVTNINENPNTAFISDNLTGPNFKIETDNSGELIERAANVWGNDIYGDVTSDVAAVATERTPHRGEPTTGRTEQEKKLDIARGLFENAMNILSNKNNYCVKNCENLTDTDIKLALRAFGLPDDLVTRAQLIEYYTANPKYADNPDIPESLKSAITNPNNSYTVRNVSAMNMFGYSPDTNDIVLKGKINVKNQTFDMVAYAKNGTQYKYDGDISGFDTKNTKYVDGALVCTSANGCEWPQILRISIPLNNAVDGRTDTDMADAIFETIDGGNAYGAGKYTFAMGNRNLGAGLRYSDFGYWVSAPSDSTDISIGARTATMTGGYDIKRVGGGEINASNGMAALATAAKIDTAATYAGGAYAVISDGVNADTKQFDGTHAQFAGTSKLTVDSGNPAASELNLNFADAGWYNITVDNSGEITWDASKLGPNAAFQIRDTAAITHMDGKVEFFGDNTTKTATEVVGTGTFHSTTARPDGIPTGYNIETADGNWRRMDVVFGASNYPAPAK